MSLDNLYSKMLAETHTLIDVNLIVGPCYCSKSYYNNYIVCTYKCVLISNYLYQSSIYIHMCVLCVQVVSVWEWTLDSDTPVCQIALGEDFSFQTFLTFHPDDPRQLISNSIDMVVFYYWVSEQSWTIAYTWKLGIYISALQILIL